MTIEGNVANLYFSSILSIVTLEERHFFRLITWFTDKGTNMM